MEKAIVGIVMGSDSDVSVMKEAAKVLSDFNIPYEVTIASAHRSPERTSKYAKSAEERGLKVIIAGAGWAAHLAGVVASETVLPVIGVPIDSSPLKGMDSLLSIVQMPGGIPVATVSIGKSGARNAGLLAVEILALGDERLRQELKALRKKMAADVAEKAEKIKM